MFFLAAIFSKSCVEVSMFCKAKKVLKDQFVCLCRQIMLDVLHVVTGTSPIMLELAIFASESSSLVPVTSPTNSNQFEVLEQVPVTCFSKSFL